MTRSKFPIHSQYPMRLIISAIIVALCLGVSSAMAEPMDQPPPERHPGAANVYVPPPDLWQQQDARSPDAIDAAEGRLPGPLPTHDDGAPWLDIGLGVGGVLLLAGGGVAIVRTRRKRQPVA